MTYLSFQQKYQKYILSENGSLTINVSLLLPSCVYLVLVQTTSEKARLCTTVALQDRI